jgi:Flp pilus assembly protein TadD
MIDELDRFRYAQRLFEGRNYASAATELEGVLAACRDSDLLHGLDDAELLLARAYYHSAQLTKAEAAARAFVDDHPSDGYAVLLLARSLERQGRRDEAAPLVVRAEALGVSR